MKDFFGIENVVNKLAIAIAMLCSDDRFWRAALSQSAEGQTRPKKVVKVATKAIIDSIPLLVPLLM